MKGTTLAWLTFIGVATWRFENSNRGALPPPSIYVGSAVLFSLLGLAAGPAPGPATAMSWALVVAALTTGAFLPDPATGAAGAGATKPGRTITSGSGTKVHGAASGPSGPVGPGI